MKLSNFKKVQKLMVILNDTSIMLERMSDTENENINTYYRTFMSVGDIDLYDSYGVVRTALETTQAEVKKELIELGVTDV